MTERRSWVWFVGLAIALGSASACAESAPDEVLAITTRFDQETALPDPVLDGSMSLEAALATRRSERIFERTEVDEAALAQLLWAGQGITGERGYRTAPSAGARFPIELYVVTADTVGHYRPDDHTLEWRDVARVLPRLGDEAYGQEWISDAPLVLVIAAVPARTEAEYGAVSTALVDRESGHVAQNILLEATAIGLAAVPVGGFEPEPVARLLGLPDGHDVRYLIPVG